MQLFRTAIICVAIALPGSGMAADPIGPLPVPAALFDWSGFYGGIEIGGTSFHSEYSSVYQNTTTGALIDAVVGYNFLTDGMLVGVEADAGYSTLHFNEPCVTPGWSCDGALNALGSLRGRVGYAADSVLIYLTGGIAVGNISGKRISPANVEYSESQVRVGYTVGGGIEAALTDTLSGRVQYQYTDLGTQDMVLDSTYAVKVTQHTLKLGVMNHFN